MSEPASASKPARAAKATVKISESKVKLEKIPVSEPAGKSGKPMPPPSGTSQAQASSPGLATVKDLEGTLDIVGTAWNTYLEAPIVDPKERFKWHKADTELVVKALQGLDEKYHFMGEWTKYMPELFAAVVMAGIIGKLVMGARWKNEQQASRPATGPEANKPASKPNPVEKFKDDLKGIFTPKQPQDPNAPPAELTKDAEAYFKSQPGYVEPPRENKGSVLPIP